MPHLSMRANSDPTVIPSVSFTSVTHPLGLSPVDSVTRIALGQDFCEGDTL